MYSCRGNFGDWGNYHDYRDYTFSNSGVGEKVILTVTGDVLLKIIAVCTTDLVSAAAASLSLGIVGNNAFMIADTLATALTAREVWNDITPTSEIELLSGSPAFIVTDGNDVVIDLTAQIDSGVIRFYYTWMPLSNDAAVV